MPKVIIYLDFQENPSDDDVKEYLIELIENDDLNFSIEN